MKTLPPMMTERLFVPFLDEVDGTICLSAAATASEIEAQAGAHRLRFPLLLDALRPLSEQIAASTHAPSSCRFGPYCDNILGMNWRLPSGRVARIGERVVKTTTGYDWLRFLLHSGNRFGGPVDYVIRLRPDCGPIATARFDGAPAALEACLSALLHGGWMHWWDAVDFITEGGTSFVRVIIHCVPGEMPVFAAQLTHVAATTGTVLTLDEGTHPPFDGLPDLVLKTTPERVPGLASALAGETDRIIGMVYCGVLHLHFEPGGDPAGPVEDLARRLAPELHSLGGDWQSRWLPPEPPSIAESKWIDALEEAIHDP